MAQQLSNLPHFKNIASGMNKWDPVHNSLFEIYFTLPDALQQTFGEDAVYLTQQVTQINGLDALNKTPQPSDQKFMGVNVSFSNPLLESTYADLDMTFNLNLRESTDNFVLKIFKAWENLSYDLSDGTRGIKKDYISDTLRCAQANRNGDIWRSFIFHNIILTNVTGLNTLDYTTNDAATLQVNFRADYWDDELA